MRHASRPVVVITNLDDATTDLVIAELHDRGVPVVRFDSGDFPALLSFSAHIHRASWEGRLTTTTREMRLEDARSLLYRRPSGFSFPHLSEQDARFAVGQARYGLGGVLASLPDCLYVNHPNRIGDAEFKPAGLAAAVRSGFAMVTNEPAAAREFAKRYGPVLYKPLHVPLYLRDGVSCSVEVAPVAPEEIDDDIAGTAHLLQVIVPKVADIRTTVIGERVFSVRIDSEALDWRTTYGRHTYTVVDTPPDVAAALFAYLKSFGLVFGAFDFALTSDGQWMFLECNPSGQWAWLEKETGLAMISAFADLLERGATS
ncbi:ATP-grasp ribosomal peptide maturase [Streptomyces litchfieldiae]|uniref:ATP-grasp ribosomal peptide maturase n=1 Tax=Streptomyces litchfieldiae TaxID=3075543 RepID=A0ABU2MT42_9ACTN|nr:ATP-grasp ribosomal peptide maturase [Streptomyces sp. DSM 44938]MDT0344795.1 ATP-grasp ribosomal peptide maturase [Streptomyces sp. DSM 44938]